MNPTTPATALPGGTKPGEPRETQANPRAHPPAPSENDYTLPQVTSTYKWAKAPSPPQKPEVGAHRALCLP